MTKPELLRLAAQIDRLWFGLRLSEAILADPVMCDEWLEVLEHTEPEAAREAVKALNGEPDCRRPRPGEIARRASEIAAPNIVALPGPDHAHRDQTPEEAEVYRRRHPEFLAALRRAAASRTLP